jgi:thiamine biosynthesis protein ThiS
MRVVINGEERQFERIGPDATLAELIAELGLKLDRVAVEWNGSIVRRPDWEATRLTSGDRLEVVHFVGGGSNLSSPQLRKSE